MLSHFYHVERERHRHNGGESFGHGRHYKHYARYEHFLHVIETHRVCHEQRNYADCKHSRRRYRAKQSYYLAQSVELVLKRRELRCRARKRFGYLPYFGVVAHRNHHRRRVARGNVATAVNHVFALGKRHLPVFVNVVSLFAHRMTFARERRLVNRKVFGGEQAAVYGYLIARFEIHDIAGNKLALLYLLHLAVAPHLYKHVFAHAF